MALVSVSKLGRPKMDLVSVQPGAKINGVYYCENVLEQGLQFAISRTTTSCSSRAPCTSFTTLSLPCIPMCL